MQEFMKKGGEDSGTDEKWMDEQLERISSGDNPEVMEARTDTRDIKADTLPSWKEPTKRILKRRVEDEKKLTIPKIVRFRAYRSVVAIDNDNEKDV